MNSDGQTMTSPDLAWHDLSDEDLLKAVAQRNKDAFRELMRRYQTRIYRIAYRFSGDAEHAAELTQDIFFKVYCAAPRYTPEAQFFTWLYRIASNHCLNFTRDRKNRPLDQSVPAETVPEAAAAGIPHDELEQRERALAVRQALDRIPERQRLALTLLRFEEMSYRDIAAVLGCSVAAVESLISRGMAALKKYLAPYREQ